MGTGLGRGVCGKVPSCWDGKNRSVSVNPNQQKVQWLVPVAVAGMWMKGCRDTPVVNILA